MLQRRIAVFLFILLLSLSFLLNTSQSPLAYSLKENFTVPTRTPTAQPASPTPPNDGGGGGQQPTPVPPTLNAATAVPTVPPVIVTLAPTPLGGFLPTAEPCSENPTIITLAITNVRQGPGSDYLIIDSLTFSEVRPIIGRSGDIPFWQVSLHDGSVGWVDSTVIETQGNTSSIPIVPAPPLNGVAPTRGIGWNPPYPASCSLLPTRTAISQENNTSAQPEVSPTLVPTSEPQVETQAEQPTAEAITPEAVVENLTVPTAGATAVSASPVIPTAQPLDRQTNQTPSNNIFIIAAAILIALIGSIAFFRRQKQG